MSNSDLLFFIINVGDLQYAKYTLPSIEGYCKEYKYSLFILEKEINPKVPASWYKLLCHRICKSQFIICCDLDMFIVPSAPPIHEIIDINKINICKDVSFYNRKLNLKKHKFKFNCGLVGIPQAMHSIVEEIYDKNAEADPQAHCWEQGYVNHSLAEGKMPVNIIPNVWNCMVCVIKRAQPIESRTHYFKHLTHGSVYNHKQRDIWAEAHFEYYKNVIS